MKFLATLMMLMFMAKLCTCDSRICYNCTGDCVSDSECKGSCMTITDELGEEAENRTCEAEVEEARCISKLINNRRYKVCYCNTERCNSSSYVSATLTVLVVALLLCFSN